MGAWVSFLAVFVLILVALGGSQNAGLQTVFGVVVPYLAVLTFFVVPAAFYLFERKRVAQVETAADSSVEAAAEELERTLPPRAAQLEEHLG